MTIVLSQETELFTFPDCSSDSKQPDLGDAERRRKKGGRAPAPKTAIEH